MILSFACPASLPKGRHRSFVFERSYTMQWDVAARREPPTLRTCGAPVYSPRVGARIAGYLLIRDDRIAPARKLAGKVEYARIDSDRNSCLRN
jgi:hypothetical protein